MAAPPPRNTRRTRARRVFSSGFYLPRDRQAVILELPEIRRALVYQRREIIVTSACNLIDSKATSLNAAARVFGVAPSWLCGMLQSYRAGGVAAIQPKPRKAGAATNCHLEVYVGL